jgi:hypothetical protein
MAKFNPNAVSTVGNEWRAYYYSGDRPEPAAALLRSTANETIASLLMPYNASGAQASYGKLWTEIYDANNLGLGEVPVTYTFLPNQDLAVGSVDYYPVGGPWTGPINNTASNVSQYIDDASDEVAYGSADLLRFAQGSYARFAFATNGLPAGRVLYVQVQLRYKAYGGLHIPLNVTLYNGQQSLLSLGGVNPAGSDTSAPSLANWVSTYFYQNPLTREPWTRADIIGMDSGSDLLVHLSGGSGAYTSEIASVRLLVTMISEKRVAVGPNTAVTTYQAGLNTTNFCTLKTPAGVPTWAKATGTDYLVVMRRLTDPYYVLPPQTQYFFRTDSGQTNPENQAHGYAITLAADGRLLTATGPETSAYALIMVKATNDLSVDTQPYWGLRSTRVYTGVTSNQRISGHGSTSYQTVRAVVGQTIGVAPNANLTFQVKRVSDNVVMGGGAATLTPARLTEHPFLMNYLGVAWYDVQLDLSANATLVAGTQYYVEVASTAAQGSPWWIYALDETHGYSGDASFGGTTDYAFVEGATQTQMDLVLTLTAAPPTAPATITVTTVNYALPDNGGAECAAGVHASARIAWSATAEGVLFAHYEVQRSEDGGSTWSTIKRVLTEATVTFDDVTAARGVALKYRVRTVRTSGLASGWRTQSLTTTLALNTEAVVFATNHDPALTVGYTWLNPEHRYEFLSDREVNVLQLHNRDFNVVYRGLEDRGVLFTFDLLLYARDDETDCGGTPPAGKGDEAFATLRSIVEHDAPNLAVFTPFGRRIFGAARLPAGHLDGESAVYATTVQVVQTSAVDAITEV